MIRYAYNQRHHTAGYTACLTGYAGYAHQSARKRYAYARSENIRHSNPARKGADIQVGGFRRCDLLHGEYAQDPTVPPSGTHHRVDLPDPTPRFSSVAPMSMK